MIHDKLEPLVASGESFDIAKTMNAIMVSIICKAAFEYDIEDKETDMCLSDLRLALCEFFTKTFANPAHLFLGKLLPERRRALCAFQNCMDASRKITEHYKTIKDPIEGNVMNLITNNSNYDHPDDLVRDVLLFIAASYDTSAYTISFTLRELSKDKLFKKTCENNCRRLHRPRKNGVHRRF